MSVKKRLEDSLTQQVDMLAELKSNYKDSPKFGELIAGRRINKTKANIRTLRQSLDLPLEDS